MERWSSLDGSTLGAPTPASTREPVDAGDLETGRTRLRCHRIHAAIRSQVDPDAPHRLGSIPEGLMLPRKGALSFRHAARRPHTIAPSRSDSRPPWSARRSDVVRPIACSHGVGQLAPVRSALGYDARVVHELRETRSNVDHRRPKDRGAVNRATGSNRSV